MTARLLASRAVFVGQMPAEIARHYSICIDGEWMDITKDQHDAAFARSHKDRTSVEAAFVANQRDVMDAYIAERQERENPYGYSGRRY